MIICKEFNNSYRNLTKENDYTVDNPAIFIDEASMGEPWNEFGKWFVDKYYNGYSMLEVLTSTRNGTQKDIDKMQDEIFDNPLKEFDYQTVCNAMDSMKCHTNMDKQKVKDYLKICVGKSISTENW